MNDCSIEVVIQLWDATHFKESNDIDLVEYDSCLSPIQFMSIPIEVEVRYQLEDRKIETKQLI